MSFGLISEPWLSRLRATSAYQVAVRVFGAGWFLILALAAGLKVIIVTKTMMIAGFSPTEWPAMLSSICLFLFYLALCWLILHRPPATRTVGIMPSLTAFCGTYLPWIIVLFEPRAASPGQNLVSALLLVVGAISMVFVIFHLGYSFSIVPQARRLVRTGPYAVVRHPLYFVEEVALLGTLLQFFSPLTFALFLAHGALQVRRIFYEEELLRCAFPEFDDYVRSTPRLIPYVW